MDGFFQLFSFFGTPFGLSLTGSVLAAIILLWEWRVTLSGLFVVQLGLAAAAVQHQAVPGELAGVMVAVIGLACLILALSAQQMTVTGSLYQSGTWTQRGLMLLLFFGVWRLSGVTLSLPQIDDELANLFLWVAICAIFIMALGENPLMVTTALLLWTMPAQVLVGALVGNPALIAVIGILQLGLALAGSYLVLVEQIPAETDTPVLTDIVFPEQIARAARRVRPEPPMDLSPLPLGEWWARGRSWVVGNLPSRSSGSDDRPESPAARRQP